MKYRLATVLCLIGFCLSGCARVKSPASAPPRTSTAGQGKADLERVGAGLRAVEQESRFIESEADRLLKTL